MSGVLDDYHDDQGGSIFDDEVRMESFEDDPLRVSWQHYSMHSYATLFDYDSLICCRTMVKTTTTTTTTSWIEHRCD
jgi:hypothetical protein